jgi:hypothetical protein
MAISPERAPQFEARMRQGGLFYAKVGAMTTGEAVVTLTA